MLKTKGRYLQISIYIMILVAFIFVMGITRNCSKIATTSIEGNSGGDTIDIAIIYNPNSLYLKDDSIMGLNMDIAFQFSNEEKIPVKIWPVADMEDAMEKLYKGIFDVLASVPLDNNIKERFPTSQSIFLDRLVLVQSCDSSGAGTEVKSSLDLNGKTITIASGSPAANRIKNLANEIGGEIEILEADGLSDELVCMKVAGGEIPFAVVNEKTAESIAKDFPILSYDNPISFSQFQVWLFNPNDSVLLQNFDKWFSVFKETDDYSTLLKKY